MSVSDPTPEHVADRAALEGLYAAVMAALDRYAHDGDSYQLARALIHAVRKARATAATPLSAETP